ncbi:hypothetical protein V1227_04855 [Lentzea sp. DG1S-22]|nr:hypothetical protein [Lentzea sp. DG1S-22]WVH82087.1 hypothetical protein V1227_04855 [Lentzea sp. DG1S-22]
MTAGDRSGFGQWPGELDAWTDARGGELRAQAVRQLQAVNPDRHQQA